jgi:hypothetical protein
MNLTDASKANKSGIQLETLLKMFLIEKEFTFTQQKAGQSVIDFIIDVDDGKIYADCTNQNEPGSVMDKIPHKIWKYHKKYNYQEVYIIRGKQIPNEQIMEHCAEICKDKNFKMHLVNFQEFCDILIKKEKTVPTLLHFLN